MRIKYTVLGCLLAGIVNVGFAACVTPAPLSAIGTFCMTQNSATDPKFISWNSVCINDGGKAYHLYDWQGSATYQCDAATVGDVKHKYQPKS